MGRILGHLLGPRVGAWRALGASTAANEKSNIIDLQNLRENMKGARIAL